MTMTLAGMPLRELKLPEAVRLYPSSNQWQVDNIPKVFALEWLPSGLLVQFRDLITDGRMRQTHYRIVTWDELATMFIIAEEYIT